MCRKLVYDLSGQELSKRIVFPHVGQIGRLMGSGSVGRILGMAQDRALELGQSSVRFRTTVRPFWGPGSTGVGGTSALSGPTLVPMSLIHGTIAVTPALVI